MKKPDKKKGRLWTLVKKYWYPTVIAVLIIQQFVNVLTSNPKPLIWIAFAAIAIGEVASIRFRQISLLLLAVFVALLALTSLDVTFALDISLFAVAYICSTGLSRAGFAIGILSALAVGYGFFISEMSLFAFISTFAIYLTSVSLGILISNYKNELNLSKSRAEAKLYQQRQIFIDQVHDSVSHALVQITILSDTSNDERTTIGNAEESLLQINKASRKGLEEMRSLIRRLQENSPGINSEFSPDFPEHQEKKTNNADKSPEILQSAQYYREILEKTGYNVDFQAKGDFDELSPEVRAELSSILKELSTNLMKYADPSQPVFLVLDARNNTLRIFCADTVRPEPSLEGTGRGLYEITNRVKRLGGNINVLTDEGTWSVNIILPYYPRQNK